jgi:hypothetical protein
MNPSIRRALVALSFAAIAGSAAAQAPLPEPRTTPAGVTYLNGGVGDEEIQAIKAAMKDYTLGLLFSRTGGEYVASVAVTIKDAKGATAFEVPSAGPYLLVKLPPGKYSVVANYRDQSKTQPVTVVAGPVKTPVSFQWK